MKYDFQIEGNELDVRRTVIRSMKGHYNSFRQRLYQCYKNAGSVEVAKQMLPHSLNGRQEDWEWLCDFFSLQDLAVLKFFYLPYALFAIALQFIFSLSSIY